MKQVGAFFVALVFVAGCDDANNMSRQPRVDAFASSEFFANGAAARPVPEGAVTQTGVAGGTDMLQPRAPRPPIAAALLAQGRVRFNVYCSPCHGEDGYGRGMIVQRGFPQPPTYHEERTRSLSDEHIYDVITVGLGKMPQYRNEVGPADRWAVIAYVRALQLSQNARLEDVPPEQRAQLDAAPTSAPSSEGAAP